MKWEIYNAMTLEHQKEYDYEFNRNNNIIVGFYCLLTIAAMYVKYPSVYWTALTLAITSRILEKYFEYKWLKQKGYLTKEKFLGMF